MSTIQLPFWEKFLSSPSVNCLTKINFVPWATSLANVTIIWPSVTWTLPIIGATDVSVTCLIITSGASIFPEVDPSL